MRRGVEAVAVPGEDLLQRLRTEGWTVVEQWLSAREFETNHLEFKNKERPATSEIDAEDKDHVAKALSAFSNTGGGLLVMGIDAGGGGKKGQAFDRVNALRPIENVEAFGGALERRLRGFTDPPIMGLDVLHVTKPAANGAGVLGIRVPASNGGPHRATCASSEVNDRYFMRTASGDQTIPHALLAALFAYRMPPRLEFRARFSGWDAGNEHLGPWVELRLANRGRSPARRPAVDLLGPPPLKWSQAPKVFGIQHRKTEGGLSYVSLEPLSTDLVVYPDTDVILATARCEAGSFDHLGGLSLRFRARLMSLDSPTFEGETRLSMAPSEPHEMALQSRAVIGGDSEGGA